jgi:hypothetical protein
MDLQLWTGKVINCIQSFIPWLYVLGTTRFGLLELQGAQKHLQNYSRGFFWVSQIFGLIFQNFTSLPRWLEWLEHVLGLYLHIYNALESENETYIPINSENVRMCYTIN